jgi:hypothetical protein
LWVWGNSEQDGVEADREFDRDGGRGGAAGDLAGVPAGHREREQDGRGAGDGAEHGAQGEQDHDGARGAADPRGGRERAVGGGRAQVRDPVREQHEGRLLLPAVQGVPSQGVPGSRPGTAGQSGERATPVTNMLALWRTPPLLRKSCALLSPFTYIW